jgi:acyl-CoA synthetase (NDP forming)
MEMEAILDRQKLQTFAAIFYPKSVAIVGASSDEHKPGSFFLRRFINAGFKGKIYPVNPSARDVLGLACYPTVSSIPDTVDYVILAVPAASAAQILEDCRAKGVKAVHIFSAGFREKAWQTGQKLEKKLVRKAREGGFRIIGPNSLGVCCPVSRMPIGPEGFMGEAGSVAYMAQSGSLAIDLLCAGNARGIGLSKLASYGNACDLDSVDFLEYFTVDPETRIIAVYLEGVRQGRLFFKQIKETSKIKPIIVWKGGKTGAGAEVATSHTGAIATSDAVWAAALKQAGAIQVDSLEEMTDTVLAFQQLFPFQGRRAAIISGLVDGGGGHGVAAADACINLGLEVPHFSNRTQCMLREVLSVGAILRNPLDLSAGGGSSDRILRMGEKAFQLVVGDPNIDLFIVWENVDVLVRILPMKSIIALNKTFTDFRKTQDRPIAVVLSPGKAELERVSVEKTLLKAQIPVFPTIERATKALVNMSQYFRFRAGVE